MTKSSTTRWFRHLACASAFVCAMGSSAFAQKGLDEPFQGPFKQALAGKTVAYVPWR